MATILADVTGRWCDIRGPVVRRRLSRARREAYPCGIRDRAFAAPRGATAHADRPAPAEHPRRPRALDAPAHAPGERLLQPRGLGRGAGETWWGDWVCVGRDEDVAGSGDYMTRDIAGESIFITRNEQGELHAFYNVCSHRGTKFVDDGSGHTRRAFKCPYHAWTYDLDGQLIGTPNVKEDEYFDRSEYPLHQVHVGSYAGFIFVNMSAEPSRTLMEALTQGAETITAFERFKMDELEYGVRLVYEVEANWKIVVDLQRVPALPHRAPRARAGGAAVPLRRGMGRGSPRRRQPNGRGPPASPRPGCPRCRRCPASRPRTTTCTTGPMSSRTSC